MRILLTGHNGFKGSWFVVLLRRLGFEVAGLSLPSQQTDLSSRIQIEHLLFQENIGDIREKTFVESIFKKTAYDFVIHFAAQSLVRESYRKPMWTFETNVNGTLNILAAITQHNPSTPMLLITTDKVYRNDGRTCGYTEGDPLGGEDPYSTSKAMADLLIQSWQTVHPQLRIGIARAGNVIGGGDSCKERLLPDLIQAYSSGTVPKLRNPNAIRPWQHVMDCLNGYLKIMERLIAIPGPAGAWNIGPNTSSIKTVGDVAQQVAKEFNSDFRWEPATDDGLKEAQVLLLDCTKANKELLWSDKLRFEESIRWTANWERRVLSGESPLRAIEEDVDQFLSIK
jgi:CDP-glucose 4,6-dehydratase